MPENAIGTLTSSDHNFAHISDLTAIRHTYCAVATLDHSKPIEPVNYIRIAASSPNSLRVFFYGETIFIRYSTTMISFSFATYMKASCSSLRVLLYD